ncbi:hypothetical protein PROFUN_12583 [Planoprotostelium fungivorum]|uniref:Uncharacterized protein n=1 Tax=Planoprotostelium fungivorum TaxID=1890364 RepID=A0A2P6N6V2_9EUKA|nr:hypothetical protein PROFUN_12583 [Planoprotostelium fungivorum]
MGCFKTKLTLDVQLVRELTTDHSTVSYKSFNTRPLYFPAEYSTSTTEAHQTSRPRHAVYTRMNAGKSCLSAAKLAADSLVNTACILLTDKGEVLHSHIDIHRIKMSFDNLSLCVERGTGGLQKPVVVQSTLPAVPPKDHVVIRVSSFAFSTNNITYGQLGETPGFLYFEFHPAPETSETSPKTHGVLPVWGFGTVEASSHPEVKVGEKVYGYFSMSRYMMVPIDRITPNAYFVPRPHLPSQFVPYNTITRCSADPMYRQDKEPETALYRPLFWTSFWMEDWLNYEKYKGADNILVTSASSKTAYCFAYVAKKRNETSENKRQVIGLTSARNVEFTKKLGLYDQVFTYEELNKVKTEGKWVYVDVSGNKELNEKIFEHFNSAGSPLAAAIILGMTNIESPKDSAMTQRDKMETFFTPMWLAKRKEFTTLEEIAEMQKKAWSELMNDSVSWLQMQDTFYNDIVPRYSDIAKGIVEPDKGHTFSMWTEESKL